MELNPAEPSLETQIEIRFGFLIHGMQNHINEGTKTLDDYASLSQNMTIAVMEYGLDERDARQKLTDVWNKVKQVGTDEYPAELYKLIDATPVFGL